MKIGQKCRLKYMPNYTVYVHQISNNLADVYHALHKGELKADHIFPVPLSELEPIQEWPKTWEELYRNSGELDGFYNKDILRGLFSTELQAESALAMAQLSQLHRAIVGDWEADWKDGNLKYCIERFYFDELFIEERIHSFRHFPFQTREQAEFSLKHHRELWEKFYMM